MSVLDFVYRHRRDRDIWIAAALIHIVFILVWRVTGEVFHARFEEHSVTAAMIGAVFFYVVLVIAFWSAQKTRLNKALALNKFFWGALIFLIGLPAQTGWYDPAPQWTRAYIWQGIIWTLFWVLVEFVNVNWVCKDRFPFVERRRFVRREADRILIAKLEAAEIELARYRGKYGEIPV